MHVDFDVANKLVNAMIEVMTEELQKGGNIKLVNFGNFKVADRAARKGYNAFYKRIIDIPACKQPVFTAGKVLKDTIRGE